MITAMVHALQYRFPPRLAEEVKAEHVAIFFMADSGQAGMTKKNT